MLTPQINLDEAFLGQIYSYAMFRPGLFYVESVNWRGYIAAPNAVELGSISEQAAGYGTLHDDGLLYFDFAAPGTQPLRYELFHYLGHFGKNFAFPAPTRQSLLTVSYNIQMRGHFCANNYFGNCPPPYYGPDKGIIQETVAVLNGVFMAKTDGKWLLIIAYAGQSYTHPHLRLIGGVKAGDYYFFDAGSVSLNQRAAFATAVGEMQLRDQRAPSISLMKDFPNYHHILECWANAVWQREAAINRHKTVQNP